MWHACGYWHVTIFVDTSLPVPGDIGIAVASGIDVNSGIPEDTAAVDPGAPAWC
jgi:hypothetical protein